MVDNFIHSLPLLSGIAVGIYAEQGPDDIAKICIDSKADIVVVESEPHLKKVLLVQHKLPELKAIVQWKGEPAIADKRRLHRTHKVDNMN